MREIHARLALRRRQKGRRHRRGCAPVGDMPCEPGVPQTSTAPRTRYLLRKLSIPGARPPAKFSTRPTAPVGSSGEPPPSRRTCSMTTLVGLRRSGGPSGVISPGSWTVRMVTIRVCEPPVQKRSGVGTDGRSPTRTSPIGRHQPRSERPSNAQHSSRDLEDWITARIPSPPWVGVGTDPADRLRVHAARALRASASPL